MRGGFRRYIGPGPGESRRGPESQTGLIALAMDILFWFFHFLVVFSTQILSFERSLSLFPGLKVVLFRIAKFLLDALQLLDYNQNKL